MLRDWVHRFNAHGPVGLKDSWSKSNPLRLSAAQQAEFVRLVETGPDRVVVGVVRWRRLICNASSPRHRSRAATKTMVLECALGGGQGPSADLTGRAGLSQNESHGTPPHP